MNLTTEQLAERLQLSEEQRKILELDSDTVVAAGAGAGKTTALTAAVLNDLLINKIPEAELCVCTFTRSSAAELLSRLQIKLEQLGSFAAVDLDQLWIGTIDSICSRFLRANALDAGVSPALRVMEPHHLRPLRQRAMEKMVDSLDTEYLHSLNEIIDVQSPDFARELISAYDQIATSPAPMQLSIPDAAEMDLNACQEAFQKLLDNPKLTAAAARDKIEADLELILNSEVEGLNTSRYSLSAQALQADLDVVIGYREQYRARSVDSQTAMPRLAFLNAVESFSSYYQQELEEAETLDFSGLASKALSFSARANNFKGFQRTYIDEAQDTSPLQQLLLSRLSNGPVISIGDANQSIYSFRGADVDNFRQTVASAHRLELADNYRSTQPVLQSINVYCANLPQLQRDLVMMRSAKEKQIEHPVATQILLTLNDSRAISTVLEAQLTVDKILEAADERGISHNDVCVLVRRNEDVADYAKAFRSRGVAALAIQGRGLLTQEECLDVIHYLRLLADPRDEEALLRVLSSPFCGLSDQRLHEICASRQPELKALFEERGKHVSTADPDYPHLHDIVRKEEPVFWERYSRVQAQRAGARATDLLRHGIDTHNYDLALQLIDETGFRWRNVEKLLWFIEDLEKIEGPDLNYLTDRLQTEIEAKDGSGPDTRLPAEVDAVRVMTIHQAKGAEFKLVAAANLSWRSRSPRQKFFIDDGGDLGLSINKDKRDSVASRVIERAKSAEEDEAARLLYVALTRAEEHLILIASGRKTKSDPFKFDGPINSLLGALRLDFSDSSLQQIELDGIPTPVLLLQTDAASVTEADDQIMLTSTEETNEDSLPLTPPGLLPVSPVPLTYSRLAAWRRCSLRRQLEYDLRLTAGSISSSQRNETELDALVFNPSSQQTGLKIHRELAEVDWRNPTLDTTAEPLLSQAQKIAGEYDLDKSETIYVERRFSVLIGTRLLTGAIDLAAYFADHALMIDWKSGDDPDDIFSSDYQLQRQLYSAAVLLDAAAPDRVDALTAHLSTGKIETSSWSLDQLPGLLEQLEQQISAILEKAPEASDREAQPYCQDCPGLSKICPVSETVD